MKNMPTRVLGRTGLQVGVIGLGTEYLFNKDRKTVVETIREAVDRGVNFFDVLGPFPEYRDNMGAAFSGLRGAGSRLVRSLFPTNRPLLEPFW